MDARGGQNLIAHLHHADRHEGEIAWDGASPAVVPDPDRRTLKERGRIAGGSLKYMRTLAPVPPVSLATALVPAGTSLLRARVLRRSGHGRPARHPRDHLASGPGRQSHGRAVATAGSPRRSLPASHLGGHAAEGASGATFGNQLTFHFARFSPSETRDVPALARTLRLQMAEAIRDGQLEAKPGRPGVPRGAARTMILRVLPWTRGGELFSFNCADLAEWPSALAECFGRSRRERVSRPGCSSPARPWGILQSLREP